MTLWTWWRGDPAPEVAGPAGFRAEPSADVSLLAHLSDASVEEVVSRLGAGHRAYVGWLGGSPAAHGWVAGSAEALGDLGLGFEMEMGDRYLWDFRTVPLWRGRGVYPRLLREAIDAELGSGARCFWMLSASWNRAAAQGLRKAGFWELGELSFLNAGGDVLPAIGPDGRVAA